MSGELPAGLRDLLKLAKSPAAPPRRADTVICAASLSKQVTLPAWRCRAALTNALLDLLIGYNDRRLSTELRTGLLIEHDGRLDFAALARGRRGVDEQPGPERAARAGRQLGHVSSASRAGGRTSASPPDPSSFVWSFSMCGTSRYARATLSPGCQRPRARAVPRPC
jgi:hypothetical protein